MRRSEQINIWIFRIAAVLLCLTVMSVWGTSRLYARYSTSASGSDSARVAKFQITQNGDALTQTQTITVEGMKPGDTNKYTVTVQSDSEVTVDYSISVKNVYENLPLEFKMQDASGKTITKDTIQPNDTATKTYTLQVTWPTSQTDQSYAGKVDLLNITLTAAQVD